MSARTILEIVVTWAMSWVGAWIMSLTAPDEAWSIYEFIVLATLLSISYRSGNVSRSAK
jgi:hypothetical protein